MVDREFWSQEAFKQVAKQTKVFTWRRATEAEDADREKRTLIFAKWVTRPRERRRICWRERRQDRGQDTEL